MKLKSVELELEWSDGLSIFDLRIFILQKLKEHGEPLRWSIAKVKPAENQSSLRSLLIEAVVILL